MGLSTHMQRAQPVRNVREVGAAALQQDGGVSVRYRHGADAAIAGARKFQLQHDAGAAGGAKPGFGRSGGARRAGG